MGVFDRAEKRIGAAVDKVFARAFKGDVQPVEIAAGIQRELDSEAKLLSRDKRLVPNVFTVSLSPHDYNRLFPYTKTLNSGRTPRNVPTCSTVPSRSSTCWSSRCPRDSSG